MTLFEYDGYSASRGLEAGYRWYCRCCTDGACRQMALPRSGVRLISEENLDTGEITFVHGTEGTA
jgi:hypothetical protein